MKNEPLKTIDSDLLELMATFNMVDLKLIKENDECGIAGDNLAKTLNMTCDGYQEEVGKWYLSDDNKIISDTMRVSFFAKSVDDAVEKMINKIKQFNPEDWKARVIKWLSTVDDSIKAKADSFIV